MPLPGPNIPGSPCEDERREWPRHTSAGDRPRGSCSCSRATLWSGPAPYSECCGGVCQGQEGSSSCDTWWWSSRSHINSYLRSHCPLSALWKIATVPSARAASTRPFTCLQTAWTIILHFATQEYLHYRKHRVLESDGVNAAFPLRHRRVDVDRARLGAQPHGRQHRRHLRHLRVSNLIVLGWLAQTIFDVSRWFLMKWRFRYIYIRNVNHLEEPSVNSIDIFCGLEIGEPPLYLRIQLFRVHTVSVLWQEEGDTVKCCLSMMDFPKAQSIFYLLSRLRYYQSQKMIIQYCSP